MTVVKTSNVELRNEIIRKNGDLKSVRETVKAFEIASEGSQMMNEAHASKNSCPATGRRCLKCGRPNHFARMCKGAANDRKDKRSNAVECEQQTNTHSGSQEEEFLEDVYLYQLKEGKSQNRTVAIHINGIPVSLHLETQPDVIVVTEKHYEKLWANCPL